jgi:methylenetetrahydrofolate reductase (NADPH)
VAITCSPVHGIEPTLALTAQLRALTEERRLKLIPHIAARMVDGPDHAAKLAVWLREHGLEEVYVIAGDAPEPSGPYEGALAFMRDLIDNDPGVRRIGIAGYPDGHALIPTDVIKEQMHAKQELLRDAGLGGWVSTQMCFDDATIRAWLQTERADGLTLPIRLGVPGVVDRARLMTMGTRLGIGTSLRYLSKNRSTVMQLMAPGGYDPTDMVVAFADDAPALGIEALHSFTFNAVADTRKWQEAITRGASA